MIRTEAEPSSADSLLIPEHGVLLHIGPPKTGTTTLQDALARARSRLPEYGVVYPGTEPAHLLASQYATGASLPAATRARWQRLVRQTRDASRTSRAIVSSEFFAEADDAAAASIVEQLGGSRVHVLVTLRPLVKILPSAWQQYVRNRQRRPYRRWLDGTLNRPPDRQPNPSFWRRHSHDRLVERWASIVGPASVTVVVLAETEPDVALRTCERLVGLPAGLLEPDLDRANRSLTFAEIELVRRLNVEFHRRGWSRQAYEDIVQRGLVKRMQASREPAPDEPRIGTPPWALDRAAAIGSAAAERIGASGVRVVGDLASLGTRPHPGPGRPPGPGGGRAPRVLPLGAASEAVLGTILSGGFPKRGRRSQESGAADTGEGFEPGLTAFTSAELATVLGRRAWRRLRSLARIP